MNAPSAMDLGLASELESISDRYAHGDCGPFAVACARAYGKDEWELVMFTAGGFFQHAAVKTPAGLYFDAYGFCTLNDLRIRYGSEVIEESATEEDLDDITGIDESEVEDADEHRILLEDLLIKAGRAQRTNGSIAPVDRIALIQQLIWSGPGYRAYNYNPPGKINVGDLVAYERDELGNQDVGTMAKSSAAILGVDLNNIPATGAIWVTATKEQAAFYLSEGGDEATDISTYDVRGWVKLVDLGEEGCLLIDPRHVPLLAGGPAAPAQRGVKP